MRLYAEQRGLSAFMSGGTLGMDMFAAEAVVRILRQRVRRDAPAGRSGAQTAHIMGTTANLVLLKMTEMNKLARCFRSASFGKMVRNMSSTRCWRANPLPLCGVGGQGELSQVNGRERYCFSNAVRRSTE